ncbi:acyl carrier protein [Streptomyces sp. NPDC055287]
MPSTEEFPDVRDTGTEAMASRSPRALAVSVGLDEAETRSVVRRLVTSHVAAILGHGEEQPLDEQRTFKDLGFDSLAALQLQGQLAEASGLRLPTTLTFDHPTPAGLCDHVVSLLAAGPDDSAAADPLPELDALRSRLASGQLDDEMRAGVLGRLQELMDLCRTDPGAGPGTSARGGLDAASDDEVFDFLTNELGIAPVPPDKRS